MYPASFEYHAATSVPDALALLARYGDDAKLLAGGHSLIPVMKLRFATPAHLIDIGRIPALSAITDGGSAVHIGATARHASVVSSPVVRQKAPLLAEVASHIGDPLINYLDSMQPSDLAILEISSFQLDQMDVSTDIAAILNITPNHLDRHITMEAYTAAKARLLDFQSADGIAILGRDDPGSWGLRSRVHGKLLTFSLNPLEEGLDGAYLDEGLLSFREGFAYTPLLRREQVRLRGDHNVSNVLAAFAIGHAAGLSLDAMLTAAEEFRGVPHRLELVRELHGAHWYNDSIATAPERTIAAIRSFEEPIVLLLGGRDKKLPWESLADLIHQRVGHVILFGEAAGIIEAALGPASGVTRSQVRVQGLHEAVAAAATVATPGSVVLLSPGGTSFDEFIDFAERGERFKTWVQELS
jgi:UDP-N-acetylmuramoylalanine--D-glutamate ligase